MPPPADPTRLRSMERRGQLELPVQPTQVRLAPRIGPMRPTEGTRPFDDPDYLFEPWWPGSRLIVFVESGRVRVQGDELADVMPAFPELAELPGLLGADGVILDGVLMVLDRSGRPEQRLLRRRLSTVEPGPGHAAFVAVDLLRAGERPFAGRPFSERRRRLEELARPSDWFAVSRGVVGEGLMLASVVADLGFEAISAHRLAARYRQGPAGDAWLRIPVAGGASPRRPPPILALFRRLPW